MAPNQEAVRVLDEMIRDAEQELDKAKKLSTDLKALRRSRALAAGLDPDRPSAAPNGGKPVLMTEIVLEMLHQSGRPMKVSEIMEQLRAKVPEAKEMTIVGHLVRFMKRGLVKRTEPSTYQAVKKP